MLKTLNKKLKSLERDLSQKIGNDLSTPAARRAALLHFYFLDHGVLRWHWTNQHLVAKDVWRSNQPSQRRLRALKRKGMKSVLNLRGSNPVSHNLLEKEACDALGLNLVSMNFSARSLVKKEILLALLDHFDTIERPFVMHCKSGADRAGLAAALYLLHVENAPIALAKKQLSVRFIHFASFQTGILDHMLNAYERDIKASPMPIRTWIETRYDNQNLTAEFNLKRGRN